MQQVSALRSDRGWASIVFWLGFAAVGCLATIGAFQVMTILWGPYARVFADAGPLIATRGGFMISLVVLPAVAVAAPLAKAKSVVHYFGLQVAMGGLAITSVLAYGYYLHNIVAWQGVEGSRTSLAQEVGFASTNAVPPHIVQALILSQQLADSDKAPWVPFAWKSIQWPAVPPVTQREE